MVRFNGVNHLAFATGDMDKTVRFWRDLLGMRLVATIGEPGFRHYFFELSETDTVAFFEWDGVEAAPEKRHGVPEKGPFIFDHVSFGVDSADALWELKDKLAAAGFDVPHVVDHGIIHSIYTWDPNGIPSNLATTCLVSIFGKRRCTATQHRAQPLRRAQNLTPTCGPRLHTRPRPNSGRSKKEPEAKRGGIKPNPNQLCGAHRLNRCRLRNNKREKSAIGRGGPPLSLPSHMHRRSFPRPRPSFFQLRSQTEQRSFITKAPGDLNANRQIIRSPVQRQGNSRVAR